MAGGVEELGKVDVHGDGVAVFDIRAHLANRLMCIAAGSKAKTRYREGRIEDWREHLSNSLLNDSVHHGRNSQHSFAAIGFGYFYPSHGLRLVSPIVDQCAQCLQQILVDCFDFVLFQGSVRGPRRSISPRRVRRCVRVGHVCSLCLIVQPFIGPTLGQLLWRLRLLHRHGPHC